ncbi:hypothetical protein [Aeromonas enteropelogenes]|uniref:hypothetical protein n=1 Tax=Aeromonas enteropelogenes TaxID=29489 RepID=UPI001CD00E49|nr:hypothetical protein [Aeromonas enteropelogenes]UBH26245.1 hypothetical protein LA358_11955 [Aeromonas enteropelogenes]
MGFWSSGIASIRAVAASPSQDNAQSISEEEALFSDFDETVARLKSFDLEAGIEQEEESELSSLPTIGNNQHDVK